MLKRVGLISLLIGLLLSVGVIAAQEPATTPEPEATPEPGGVTSDDPVLARGEYIVRVVSACINCHANTEEPYTPVDDVFTAELSGGAAFAYQPFGVVYAPNLTTLGDWTDEEIENAIRYGVHPDGSVLLPPMPYEAYALMADEDMAAVIAYLRSLEPVEKEIPPAELIEGVTRESVRPLPEMTDEPITRPGEDATPAERGAYLGTAVAACVQCHGSVDENGQLQPLEPLAGEVLFHTPFGSDTLPSLLQEDIGEYPDEGLMAFITGHTDDPVFFMPVYAFQHLDKQDLADIVAWLRTQP